MSTHAERTGILAAALIEAGRPARYKRGQALFSEGDRGERVFLITDGCVLISCVGSEGREIVLGVNGPGR